MTILEDMLSGTQKDAAHITHVCAQHWGALKNQDAYTSPGLPLLPELYYSS
jgi:hypothetical protein